MSSCLDSVCCPDCVRILCPVSVCSDSVCLDSVGCLDFVRIFVKKAVRRFSVRCSDSVRNFRKKRCPLSVCAAGQGRDIAVWTFGVLVRRRLPWAKTKLVTGQFLSYDIHSMNSILCSPRSQTSVSAGQKKWIKIVAPDQNKSKVEVIT